MSSPSTPKLSKGFKFSNSCALVKHIKNVFLLPGIDRGVICRVACTPGQKGG
jgi:hypothetical protein